MKRFGLCLLLSAGSCLGVNILNSPSVDSSLFRVTQFASGQPLPNSVIRASDGSILALQSPQFSTAQVVRYVDANRDGIADGAPTVLYSNTGGGAATQIRQAGEFYYIGEFGQSTIRALKSGGSAADPLTSAGALQFSYPAGHLHPSAGIAVRKTPGENGSVDLVFNVGSQYNNAVSTDPVKISGMGLGETNLDSDSLYMLTISESTGVAVASNLRKVATGIRNVYGMAFDPATGDLWFADNAIDEENPSGNSEPFMVDELNRIAAADLGTNLKNFGYPNCYPEYRTGSIIEVTPGACNGVTQSVVTFQPVPNTLAGARSEGPTEIAFAPSLFPALYQGGIFAGFSGGGGPNGTNNQNPLAFVNANRDALSHFISPGVIGNILGVYSTEDSLFVADWGGGSIYQITALEQVPEPGVMLLTGLGLIAVATARRMRS